MGEEVRLPEVRHAIGLYIALFMVLFLGLLLLASALLGLGLEADDQPFAAVAAIVQALLMIWVVYLFVRYGRFDAGSTLSLRPCSVSAYFWAASGLIALGLVVGQLISYLNPGLESESLAEFVRLSHWDDPLMFMLFAAAISLGPGVSEELAFRGFFLRGLLSRLSPRQAVILTAAAFALFHLDPLHILLAFPAGLWLGYVVVRTGSIYPAIAGHALNNLWATLEAGFWQSLRPEIRAEEIIFSTVYGPFAGIIALLVLVAAVYALKRLTPVALSDRGASTSQEAPADSP
jgi:membrane protease YdiL (CAAX protease family)